MEREVDRKDHRCVIGRDPDPSNSAVRGGYAEQLFAFGNG